MTEPILVRYAHSEFPVSCDFAMLFFSIAQWSKVGSTRLRFPLLLLLATFWLSVATQSAASDVRAPESTLAATLTDIHKRSGFAGFAVVLQDGTKTHFSQAFGTADFVEKRQYQATTIQPVASVSKVVIGIALMKAQEQGKLTLDEDINGYLPFSVKNPHAPNDRITLRSLATHTSGIVDDSDFTIGGYGLSLRPERSIETYLREYFEPSNSKQLEKRFAKSAVGSNYSYSNIGSTLAAYVIERRVGKPFDEFAKEEIFAPLGMTDTHYFFDTAFAARYAKLFEINPQPYPLYTQLFEPRNALVPKALAQIKSYSNANYPDGSLRSSASDLSKLMSAVARGLSDEATVISAASMREMTRPQFTAATMPRDMDRREPNRGIFWAHARNGNVRHTGGDPGVTSFVSIDPKTLSSRVFVMNTQVDGDENKRAVDSFIEIVRALDAYDAARAIAAVR